MQRPLTGAERQETVSDRQRQSSFCGTEVGPCGGTRLRSSTWSDGVAGEWERLARPLSVSGPMADVQDTMSPTNRPPLDFENGRNDVRRAVRSLLSVNAPTLVGLYDAAVRMLHDEQFPARKLLISHCVREIGNSLPSFFGDVAEGRAEYQALVQAVIDPWRDAGLPIGGEVAPVPVSDPSTQASQTVGVPLAVVHRVGVLLKAHVEAQGRRQRNADTLFRALSGDMGRGAYHLRPVIKLWLKTCDWFLKGVHHNRLPQMSIDNALEQEFIARFEQFENLLYSMTVPFLTVARDLDEELDQANS